MGIVYVLDTAMFVRAIMSFFNPMGDDRISIFLTMITEPIILPFRKLCASRHWFEGSPLDVPFFMAVVALLVLQMLIGGM